MTKGKICLSIEPKKECNIVMSSPIAENENIFPKCTSIYNVTHQKHSIFMLVNVRIL